MAHSDFNSGFVYPCSSFAFIKGDPKKNRIHKSLNKIFNTNYTSFLFQVVVVELVHEILQQYFSHHVLVNQREGIMRERLLG